MGGNEAAARTPGSAGDPVRIEFWGVRGSTPCDGPAISRYGGNTSCVVVEAPGEPPLVLDVGTGVRAYGNRLEAQGRATGFEGVALLTHLHWDHIIGLPFFGPIATADGTLDVFGPQHPGATLSDVFAGVMRPPYFPVRPDELSGTVRFHDVGAEEYDVHGYRIRAGWVPHTGPTLGFRVEAAGVSIVYVPDHGAAFGAGREGEVPPAVVDLSAGADLLIHDAQFTDEEQARKPQFGHCTVDYAAEVARRAGVRRLALFHHDPAHSDGMIDALAALASDRAERLGAFDVVAAREGLVLAVTPAAVPAAAGARGTRA